MTIRDQINSAKLITELSELVDKFQSIRHACRNSKFFGSGVIDFLYKTSNNTINVIDGEISTQIDLIAERPPEKSRLSKAEMVYVYEMSVESTTNVPTITNVDYFEDPLFVTDEVLQDFILQKEYIKTDRRYLVIKGNTSAIITLMVE